MSSELIFFRAWQKGAQRQAQKPRAAALPSLCPLLRQHPTCAGAKGCLTSEGLLDRRGETGSWPAVAFLAESLSLFIIYKGHPTLQNG